MTRHLRVLIILGCVLFLPGLPTPAVRANEGVPPPPPAVTTPPPAPADQPMTVVRMRGKDMCGSICPEWIMAQGAITPQTPERFRQLLASLGTRKLPVVIDSEGGDLDAALAIGRMIRAQGLTTVVGRAVAQGCTPRDVACSAGRPPGLPYQGFVTPQGACSAACLFILAGGVERAGYWMTEARLPAPETFKTRHAGGDAEAQIGVYLAEMGISPGLMPRIRRLDTPLDRNDMLHFGLATGRQRVEDLTGASICLGATPAANCVAVASAKPAPPVALKPSVRPAWAANVQQRPPAPPRPARFIIWGAIGDM